MILWVCINEPGIALQDTCIQEIQPQKYDSLVECRNASVEIYELIKNEKLYFTSFCSHKDLTSI